MSQNQNILQWNDIPKKINYAPKEETILLFGGLTPGREKLLQAAAASLGEYYTPLPNTDNKAFELGKIYGNKGQCNPTYYTVGNLIKYLIYLRDEKKIPTSEIVRRYVHVTVSGCGPCRFGMYITEYKKALKDAGFEGFRVVSFEHNKSPFQEASLEVVKFSPKFFIILIKTTLIADILDILGYQMRPYEVDKGSVDKALKACEDIIIKALTNKKSLIKALKKCKKILKKVKLNRLQLKPKVMVMGEFWAALTNSDGNYHIHRFLEQEGAEVIAQPLINRILLNVWEAQYLNEVYYEINAKKFIDFSGAKKKLLIVAAKKWIHWQFKIYAKAIGLKGYELANMDYLFNIAKKYYNQDSNGGEGHLEVAHLLEAIKHNTAHLVISVKPFGCMPSSGVSDGVQSLITSKFPEANFLSVETSGDGAVNFYSRIQMALFKAKEKAVNEIKNFKIPKNIPKFINSYDFLPKSNICSTAGKLLEFLNKN
jgi:predicted nucleotide-binding protein (sugar kinase/HSP70/actin superfamily)